MEANTTQRISELSQRILNAIQTFVEICFQFKSNLNERICYVEQ